MIQGRLLLAILVANILSILPLPPSVSGMRPSWILLLLLYLQSYVPHSFHVLGVLFLGLCLDALLSTPMGEHAFALIITTWLMIHRTQRFMFFSVIQQMLVIGLAALCYHSILYIADASFGHIRPWYTVIGAAVVTMIFWPLLVRIDLGKAPSATVLPKTSLR
ncbi:MAG TPA: rod shape-determining protein MreD [Legionellaceae bacterium]|nr:rod shape-determining protein MreD [Legionellaceae bacterium]